jgi:hypothetical protein
MFSGANDWLLVPAVKNHYVYKMKTCSGYLCGLILAQILAAVMLLAGNSSMNFGSGNLDITFHIYSAQIFQLFSVLWGLIVSVLMTTRANKDAAFTVPGNRISDCLADIAFLLTCSLFGGVTTVLLETAMRVEIYFDFMGKVLADGFYPQFSSLCIIFVATMLYILLISAAGYCVGTLIRFHKVFIIIIPALFFGLRLFNDNFSFFLSEKSLALFALKVIISAAVLFAVSIAVASRMEVRK